MPPRRSPRQAAKQEAEKQPESLSTLKEAQNAFVNALASRGRGGQIVEVVIPVRKKRKATTPEPAPSSPPAGREDAEEEEEENDDAPEPVSMKSGRKAAEDEAKKVKEFEQTTAAKRREANRKRDQTLKERADAQGGKRKRRTAGEDAENIPQVTLEEAASIPLPPSDGVDEEQISAEKRMERAMAEAAKEDEDEEADQPQEDQVILGTGDIEMDEHDDSATAVSGDAPEQPRHTHLDVIQEEEEPSEEPAPTAIPRQLPDHLFASAAAAISEALKKDTSQKKAKRAEKVKEKEQKRRRKDSMKDRVVGSRVVKVVPSHSLPDTGTKTGVAAARFVRQRLNLAKPQNGLKKQKNLKGWDR
ncbi:hypothetical protein DACRYDRAFT_21134, partial [Dacryopinax primogenitus]